MVNICISALWLFNFCIAILGFKNAEALPQASRRRRFAVLVAAYNEEAVIGQFLASMDTQTYPCDCFDVYVSADNCTDKTAEIAGKCGAIVLERFDETCKGKTWNIRWALEQIDLNNYCAIIIFDADNLAHSDYLEKMNDYMEAHPDAEAIQGYLDSKNPDDTWVTKSYALAYWYTNRFWQLARSHWGLSAALGGTGFLVKSETLKRIGWNPRSLTEDLEFSTIMILEGKRIHWNEWAVTYDEKPLLLKHSYRQRMRWMQGHMWVFWHYGGKMLGRFLNTGRIQYLDTLIYLFAPAKVIMNTIWLIGGFFMPVAYIASLLGLINMASIKNMLILTVLALLQGTMQLILAPSLRFRHLTLRYVPMLFWWIIYGMSWPPLTIQAIFKVRNQNTWVKTDHTRSIGLGEIGR